MNHFGDKLGRRSGRVQRITCPLHAWGVRCPGPCMDPQSALSEVPLYHRLPPGCHSDWTEAPGLNIGGLLWICTAPRSGPSPQVQPWHAVGPPCLQILDSHTWDALHLGWKLSRVQQAKKPALEDRFSTKSKNTFAHKCHVEVRKGSGLHPQ